MPRIPGELDPAAFLLFLLPAVLLLIGILVVRRGYYNLRERRRIQDRPTSKTRSLAMGPVELSGVSEGVVENADPVYGRPFLHFSLVVQRKEIVIKDKKLTTEWKTFHSEDAGTTPFWLKDDTGRALVWGPEADFRSMKEVDYTCGFFGSLFGSSASPELAYLRKTLKRRIFFSSHRLFALYSRPGGTAWVHGAATRAADQKRDAYSDALAAAAAEDAAVIVAGADGLVFAESEAAATPSGAGVFAAMVFGWASVAISLAAAGALAFAYRFPHVLPLWPRVP